MHSYHFDFTYLNMKPPENISYSEIFLEYLQNKTDVTPQVNLNDFQNKSDIVQPHSMKSYSTNKIFMSIFFWALYYANL